MPSPTDPHESRTRTDRTLLQPAPRPSPARRSRDAPSRPRAVYARVRSGPGCADLSRRTGMSTPRCSSTTGRSAIRRALLITPDHYVLRLLHAVGVPARSARCRAAGRRLGGAAARPLATAARSGGSWPTHWDVFLGTPVRYWFETELHDVFGLTEHAVRRQRRRPVRPAARGAATRGFRPRALFERSASSARDDGRPVSDLSAHAALRDDPSFTGRVLPTFRADASSTRRGPGGRRRSADRRRGRASTRRPTRAARRLSEPDGSTSSATARPRPTPVCPTQVRSPSTPPTRNASTPRRSRAPVDRRRRRRLPAHDALRGRGDGGGRRPRHAAAPGRAAEPPPADARALRARHRSRPAATCVDLHGAAPPVARVLRHASRGSAWCSSPSTRPRSRARSRRWPASTRRCTRAPRGGSSTPRPRSGATGRPSPTRRRFHEDIGVHRRHPGVLLHPCAARHVAAGRRGVPGVARRHAPDLRGGRPPHRPAHRVRHPAGDVQALTRATAARVVRRGAGGAARPGAARCCRVVRGSVPGARGAGSHGTRNLARFGAAAVRSGA